MMNMTPARNQKGFTLIELVMVIVILGILAAFALPRFADLGGEARESAIKGAAGAIKSASAIVHSTALAKGETGTTATTIEIDGADIAVVKGYATAAQAGILDAAQITGQDFHIDTGTANTVIVRPLNDTTNTSCQVSYEFDSTNDDAPTISLPTSLDC